jgi:hypothetical protein
LPNNSQVSQIDSFSVVNIVSSFIFLVLVLIWKKQIFWPWECNFWTRAEWSSNLDSELFFPNSMALLIRIFVTCVIFSLNFWDWNAKLLNASELNPSRNFSKSNEAKSSGRKRW